MLEAKTTTTLNANQERYCMGDYLAYYRIVGLQGQEVFVLQMKVFRRCRAFTCLEQRSSYLRRQKE